MSLPLTALTQARWERYCQLAAATALVWEYLITWADEYEYFWKKRWSFGKSLFLWSRYYSLFYNIANAIVFMQARPSFEVCSRFFHWQNTGATLQIITTHVVLQLRLYAMYGSSKFVLAFFVFLTGAEITVMAVVFGKVLPGQVATNQPHEGVFICADGDPSGRPWVAFTWTSLLTMESIMLCMAIYKAYENSRTGAGGGLMRLLTRDSVLYFLFIFWIYLANQIIWLKNDLTLNELGTGFALCISAILANRLMISVRTKFYTRGSETRDNFDAQITEITPYSITEDVERDQDGLPVTFVRSSHVASAIYSQSWGTYQTLGNAGGQDGGISINAIGADGTPTSLTLTSVISISPKADSEFGPDAERIPVGM